MLPASLTFTLASHNDFIQFLLKENTLQKRGTHEAEELALFGSKATKNHLIIGDMFTETCSTAHCFDFDFVFSLVFLGHKQAEGPVRHL